jgi:two-component system LytT family response regulator
MNCVIVDDNPLARMAMAELVSQVSDLTCVGECANAIDAFNLLQNQKVDLLLLDIEMPGTSGIELTRNLGNRSPVIIFTTGKKEYAVDAFELDVADYLVKPVSPARFFNSIEKAREIIAYKKGSLPSEEQEFVFVRENGMLKKVMLEEILFMEAMGDYVKIFVASKFYMVHSKLRSIEEKLPPVKFLKVHRSFIVALNKIERIEEGVIVINQKPIPVADAYRSTLNSRLHIL